MTLHRFRTALLGVLLVFATACGDGGDDADGASEPTEVVIELVAFQPAELDVEAGTTVAWAQRDPGEHTVTSGTVEQGAAGVTTVPDDEFASGELATGETFERTFDQPGTYPYFCSLHPATMRGEVRVTDPQQGDP